MKKQRDNAGPSKPPLRAEAEQRLARAPPSDANQPAEALLHELQVHQVELEMQNEALRQIQTELEESRDRYVDLYDFAPVGYLSLSASGLIKQINLAGASLLGEERKRLINRRFASFVAPEDRERWYQKSLSAKRQLDRQHCELLMRRADDSSFHAGLEYLHMAPGLRISLTDISERRRAEEELRIASIAFESQEGMLVTDAEGTIVRANQSFARLTGYSASEALVSYDFTLYRF